MLPCLKLAALMKEGAVNEGAIGGGHFSACIPGKRGSQSAVGKKSKANAWISQGAEVPDCIPTTVLSFGFCNTTSILKIPLYVEVRCRASLVFTWKAGSIPSSRSPMLKKSVSQGLLKREKQVQGSWPG